MGSRSRLTCLSLRAGPSTCDDGWGGFRMDEPEHGAAPKRPAPAKVSPFLPEGALSFQLSNLDPAVSEDKNLRAPTTGLNKMIPRKLPGTGYKRSPRSLQ